VPPRAAAAAVACALALLAGCGGDETAGLREPETDAERAAAGVVERYLAAVGRRDAAKACRVVAPGGSLRRRLRCDGRPRLPRELRVRRAQDGRLLAVEGAPAGEVRIAAGVEGGASPAQVFTLRPGRGGAPRIVAARFGGFG